MEEDALGEFAHLPNELQFHVFSFLLNTTPKDVINCARTCKHFFQIISIVLEDEADRQQQEKELEVKKPAKQKKGEDKKSESSAHSKQESKREVKIISMQPLTERVRHSGLHKGIGEILAKTFLVPEALIFARMRVPFFTTTFQSHMDLHCEGMFSMLGFPRQKWSSVLDELGSILNRRFVFGGSDSKQLSESAQRMEVLNIIEEITTRRERGHLFLRLQFDEQKYMKALLKEVQDFGHLEEEDRVSPVDSVCYFIPSLTPFRPIHLQLLTIAMNLYRLHQFAKGKTPRLFLSSRLPINSLASVQEHEEEAVHTYAKELGLLQQMVMPSRRAPSYTPEPFLENVDSSSKRVAACIELMNAIQRQTKCIEQQEKGLHLTIRKDSNPEKYVLICKIREPTGEFTNVFYWLADFWAFLKSTTDLPEIIHVFLAAETYQLRQWMSSLVWGKFGDLLPGITRLPSIKYTMLGVPHSIMEYNEPDWANRFVGDAFLEGSKKVVARMWELLDRSGKERQHLFPDICRAHDILINTHCSTTTTGGDLSESPPMQKDVKDLLAQAMLGLWALEPKGNSYIGTLTRSANFYAFDIRVANCVSMFGVDFRTVYNFLAVMAQISALLGQWPHKTEKEEEEEGEPQSVNMAGTMLSTLHALIGKIELALQRMQAHCVYSFLDQVNQAAITFMSQWTKYSVAGSSVPFRESDRQVLLALKKVYRLLCGATALDSLHLSLLQQQ